MAAEAPAVRGLRARPEWLDTVGTQALALAGAFLFAAVTGAIIILPLWRGSALRLLHRVELLHRPARGLRQGAGERHATHLLGLAVAVAFKAGLFNIGVEGQYFVAMMTAATAAIFLDFLSPRST